MTYTYQDVADLPTQFTFQLEDEAGLQATINSLNNAVFNTRINAPGNISIRNRDTSDNTVIEKAKDFISDNFALQRLLGRDFDNPDASVLGTITRTYVADAARSTSTTSLISNPEKSLLMGLP